MAAVGQLQSRLDPGYAASDDQSGIGDGEGALVLCLQHGGTSYRAADQILGLVGSRRSILPVDPAAVLADVGHVHQIRIQAGILDALAKGRLVDLGRA